jgi:hypothetical protein
MKVIFSFMCILRTSLFPYLLYLLATELSVLLFKDSDYPFGIFKLFLFKKSIKFDIYVFIRIDNLRRGNKECDPIHVLLMKNKTNIDLTKGHD